MSKEIDRRNFIGIIFGTVSTAALSGPLEDLWPTKAKKRPQAEPIVFELRSGYIIDPDYDHDANWPTVREHRFNCPPAEAIDHFHDLIGDNSETYDDLEKEFGKPAEKWSKAEVPFLEAYFKEQLDEDVDPDYLSFRASAENSEYWAGIRVLEELGDERAKELGLYLVEGEHPGSSFCGVAFDGDIEELNLALATRAMNLFLRTRTR